MILLPLFAQSSLSQEVSQDQPAASATAKPFQWNAVLDAYGASNLNGPPSSTNSLRAFDAHSGELRLGAASLDLDYKTDHFGAHLTGGYGDRYTVLSTGDTLRGANSYLGQYYLTYRPIKDSGLVFDFGKFYTNVGAEGIEPQTNFNYSRSLLFNLGEPFDHFGLRVVVPVTKTFSVGGQVFQGWNHVADNNSSKSYAVTTALTKSKWAWSQIMVFGPEKDGTNEGVRQTYNEVLTFSPRSTIQGYVELLYARDRRGGGVPGSDSWYGAASAARWSLTKKFSVSPRFEFYSDQTGFTTGVRQRLEEITATAEYRPHPIVTTRLEYREDFSDQAFFEQRGDRHSHQQGTVMFAILLALKGER